MCLLTGELPTIESPAAVDSAGTSDNTTPTILKGPRFSIGAATPAAAAAGSVLTSTPSGVGMGAATLTAASSSSMAIPWRPPGAAS
jgi:hypothetical protein